MKTQLLTFALALTLSQTAIAKNTTQKIDKVTSSVTVSEDVDYIITGTTPFSTTGSINITNTEPPPKSRRESRPKSDRRPYRDAPP